MWPKMNWLFSLSLTLFRLLKQHRNRSYWCTDYDADGNWPVHFTCQMWICICDGKGLDRFTQMYCQISGTNENIGASTVLNRIDLSLSFLSSLITVISFSSHLRPFLKKQPEQIKESKNKIICCKMLKQTLNKKRNKIKSRTAYNVPHQKKIWLSFGPKMRRKPNCWPMRAHFYFILMVFGLIKRVQTMFWSRRKWQQTINGAAAAAATTIVAHKTQSFGDELWLRLSDISHIIFLHLSGNFTLLWLSPYNLRLRPFDSTNQAQRHWWAPIWFDCCWVKRRIP